MCALQKQYGKTPAEIETLVEGFAWALAAYPMRSVVDGIRRYILMKSDIPAPADILAIIDPPKPKRVLSAPVYIALKQKIQRGEYIWDDAEKQFMRDFESQAIHGNQEEREEYNKAQTELLQLTHGDGA